MREEKWWVRNKVEKREKKKKSKSMGEGTLEREIRIINEWLALSINDKSM